jgi:hypothetical protein
MTRSLDPVLTTSLFFCVALLSSHHGEGVKEPSFILCLVDYELSFTCYGLWCTRRILKLQQS